MDKQIMDENTPAGFLESLVGRKVQIKSKWGPMYIGILVSCDAYMNVQLAEGVEKVEEKETELGEMLLRNNNILHISEVHAGFPCAILFQASVHIGEAGRAGNIVKESELTGRSQVLSDVLDSLWMMTSDDAMLCYVYLSLHHLFAFFSFFFFCVLVLLSLLFFRFYFPVMRQF
eukprot:gene6146-4425_t